MGNKKNKRRLFRRAKKQRSAYMASRPFNEKKARMPKRKWPRKRLKKMIKALKKKREQRCANPSLLLWSRGLYDNVWCTSSRSDNWGVMENNGTEVLTYGVRKDLRVVFKTKKGKKAFKRTFLGDTSGRFTRCIDPVADNCNPGYAYEFVTAGGPGNVRDCDDYCSPQGEVVDLGPDTYNLVESNGAGWPDQVQDLKFKLEVNGQYYLEFWAFGRKVMVEGVTKYGDSFTYDLYPHPEHLRKHSWLGGYILIDLAVHHDIFRFERKDGSSDKAEYERV